MHKITWRSSGILLIGYTGNLTNEIGPLLFSFINEESKAETDLLCLGRGFDNKPGQAGHP